jgi:hypothetical protein
LVNIDSNNEWVASNVDEGHLNYYFFLLAALMMFAQLCFMYMSAGYSYADPEVLDALSQQSQVKQQERESSVADRDAMATKPLLSIDDEDVRDEY